MNESTDLPKKIYADANFLISYWINDHEDHERARKLFFELIENDSIIFISPLVLDESWYKIRYILKKLKCAVNIPFKDFYQNFKKLFEFIVSSPYFRIIQFRSDFVVQGCREALENIRWYNFRPHDAFHLALVKDNKICAIVTVDSDFTKSKNKELLGKERIKIVTF